MNEGLTRADIERCLCEPLGLRFNQLAGFPPPTHFASELNPVARWSGDALVRWLTDFFRLIARQLPEFGKHVALVEFSRPNASAEELMEYAIDEVVKERVALVLMKRLPKTDF